MSQKGIVSTSSLQASLAGVKIIERGGNVCDAAIATSAVLSVTQNNLCGLGGDGFALLRNDKGIVSINSSGKSSRNINAEIYEKKGLSKIPYQGKLAAINVPGLVGLWIELYRNATMELGELLEPAIALAKNGFPVTHNYAKSIEVTLRHTKDKNFINTFSSSGNHPLVGDIFYQEDLAVMLNRLSEEGLDSFYRGNVADFLVKSFAKSDVVIDVQDMKGHKALVDKPLSTEFEDRTIHELQPNSQGATVNFTLNVLKTMDDEKNSNWKMMKAMLIGNKFRNHFIGDPERLKLPNNFQSPDFVQRIVEMEESDESKPGREGDTTYFTIALEDGSAISMIQSNYTGFGSTVVPEGTGFSLQNRGSYFSLDPNHHNFLEPNKRTFHTLCAGMIERGNEFEFSIGTMGGDIQPQIHISMINNLILKAFTPQESIDLPRINFIGSIYEKPSQLIFEDPELVTKEMLGIFKDYKFTGQLSSSHGHCQIIKRNENGVLMGGADPRGDGFAIPIL